MDFFSFSKPSAYKNCNSSSEMIIASQVDDFEDYDTIETLKKLDELDLEDKMETTTTTTQEDHCIIL